MAKRYQPYELLGEQGGVQTFAGRDAVNGLPVRLYSFMGEPTSREGELHSDFIPPVLSSSFSGAAGEVVSAFSGEFKRLKGAVEPRQVEALLRETAAALDDAARAGVVHGDLSPERVFFDREAGESGRFVLEGYGVPWPVRPSEFSAPERIGGASFAADIFSWARTVKHLSGPLPGDLRDLLDHCLGADPAERPHAREVRAALERYPFSSGAPKPNQQAHRDTSAFEQYTDYSNDYSNDYSGGYDNDDPGTADNLGAESGNLSELTLPPKTIKLEEYRRQQVRVVFTKEAALQPEPATPAPTVPAPTSSSVKVAPPPVTKAPPPKETLKQIDATDAYKVRLASYTTQQGNTTPAQVVTPATPRRPAPAVRVVAEPERQTQPQTPQAPGAARAETPAETRAAVYLDVRSETNSKTRSASSLPKTSAHEPGADESEFEVIDDIDDRAPDPTLYRGGRRVLLLTLLGIALLVLLALQFI